MSKLRVFISWSGSESQEAATQLQHYLPRILQSVDPWISTDNIGRGARWGLEIATALEATNFGIICVTRDNQDAQWLNFEAGALSKHLDSARVCPYLIGMKPDKSELRGPLTAFNAVTAESQDDTLKLINSLNEACENAIQPDVAQDAFERFWPELSEKIGGIAKAEAPLDAAAENNANEQLAAILAGIQRIERDIATHTHPTGIGPSGPPQVVTTTAGTGGLAAALASPTRRSGYMERRLLRELLDRELLDREPLDEERSKRDSE